MFGYYLDLARRGLGRNRVLTMLMVLAITLGIGISMTTLTVLHALSGDPIPQKSGQLFRVRLNILPDDAFKQGEPLPENLTRRDAETLLGDARADRQAVMSAGSVVITSARGDNLEVDSRYTSADFFPMFDVPMRFGSAWGRSEDLGHARVVVISSTLNEQLFEGRDSVGQMLHIAGQSLRIVGVMGDWDMNPRFYDLSDGTFGGSEDVFLPLSTAVDMKLASSGNMWCWGNASDPQQANAPCMWLQYWAQIKTTAQLRGYRDYLSNYMTAQRQAGRFTHTPQWMTQNVMEWLDSQGVVPADVRLQSWLALGFLGICIFNTVGLLLAKFLRRSREIGIRRALGATRRAIFAQCLVEAGAVGIVGGLFGWILASLGVMLVQHQPTTYAPYVHMDLGMMLATFALALSSSLLAGVLPAWRATRFAPSVAIKSN
ncbi:ABC transporter permease [Frateuria aurantia]